VGTVDDTPPAEPVESQRASLDLDGAVNSALTSDDDRTLLPKLTHKMSKRYEDAIRRVLTERAPDHVRVDGTHLPGEKSGIDRQIDVLLTAPLMDDVSSVIVVECKNYARRVGIGTVDELCGKLVDVGAEHGVLCAPNGFTAAARARAKNARHPRIALYDLSGDDELDLDDLFGPDCPALGCDWGTVSWAHGLASSGDRIGMGRCGSCGSLAVRCETCGYVLAADSVDECECGYKFQEGYWHDGSDWVVRLCVADGVEEQFDWERLSDAGETDVDV
jgi:hypothetical protein